MNVSIKKQILHFIHRFVTKHKKVKSAGIRIEQWIDVGLGLHTTAMVCTYKLNNASLHTPLQL